MTMAELAKLVADMRHVQNQYFRTRSHDDLEESKLLERRVDEACRNVLDGQKKLFGES